jgi:Ca2+-binding EF-hand superfamily protein
MSTITGVSARSTYNDAVSSGGAHRGRRADKLFDKVDTDGDGSVDSTELQSMLDNIKAKTGTDLGSASDVMSKLDTNGDGTLSKDELSSGMKELMPPPSSTVDFAQRSGGGSAGGSTSTDPLDTNGDGVVSAEEAAAGSLKDLFAAVDSNGDHQISKSEFETFQSNLQAALAGDTSSVTAAANGSTSSDGSDSSSSTEDNDAKAFSAMIDLVLKQYGQTEAQAAQVSDSSLSLTA